MKKLIPEKVKKFSRAFLSYLGALRFGFPNKKLKIIGVTGTSGKSTTAAMIFHILKENGLDVGMISTVGAIAGNKKIETGLHVTTPDPFDLQKLLSFMVKREVKYVVLEMSSHGLAQGRAASIAFDYAVFTNIKEDHLDWHGSWEEYAKSKAILAKKVTNKGKIVVNREDKKMYDFISNHVNKKIAKKFVTYSFNEIFNISEQGEEIMFRLNDINFVLPILGLYNVENAIAAINVSNLIGLSYKQIANSLKVFNGLEGRMQVMQREPFYIIVDFAHNSDSLEKSLSAVKKLAKGKIINVFGSAGLRDIEKRFLMGEISGRYADITIVTSEDPRTEPLKQINSQIIEGVEKGGAKLLKRFEDTSDYENYEIDSAELKNKVAFAFDEESINSRVDAIKFAIQIAREGDLVIIEGKGHEKSLCFGETEYPYSDQEVVTKTIKKD